MKLNDLVIDYDSSLAGTNYIVDEPKVYEGYKEGVKTGPEGIIYTVMSEGLNFDKVNIKVAGSLVPITRYEGKPIPVEFDNLDGKVWQDFKTHEIKISLTAKAIHLVGDSKRIKIEGNK